MTKTADAESAGFVRSLKVCYGNPGFLTWGFWGKGKGGNLNLPEKKLAATINFGEGVSDWRACGAIFTSEFKKDKKVDVVCSSQTYPYF